VRKVAFGVVVTLRFCPLKNFSSEKVLKLARMACDAVNRLIAANEPEKGEIGYSRGKYVFRSPKRVALRWQALCKELALFCGEECEKKK
jgi:hypothetical protein